MDETKHKAIFREMERISHLMDTSIGIPGTKFKIGFDPLIGLIPGGGDLVGALIALYVVARAAQLGIPKRTLLRMIGNVAVDGVLGSVPIAGDVFDAFYKANKRNVKLALDALPELKELTEE